MITVSVSIDVPDLTRGAEFYSRAFGFSKSAEPVPGVVVMRVGKAEICLLEKSAGSRPSNATGQLRHYQRHWTPVHLDIHVDDLQTALTRVINAGATCEQRFDDPEQAAVAFCSDPFGHGFCLVERKR